MNVTYAYPRARWIVGVVLQDVVLCVALGLIIALRQRDALSIALGIAIPVVLAWGFATLHFPSAVTIDETQITFHAYGRAHRFAWEDVARVHVRRFLVRDRVLVRLIPARGQAMPWRGRYWITRGIAGYDELVAALETRSRKEAV